MGFSNDEKGMTQIINKLFNLISLNVIWLVCCIPIITIGAATTAMYDVLLRLNFREEIPVVHTFFKKFVFHIKKATVLHLMIIAGTAFLIFDFWCSLFIANSLRIVVQVIILTIGFFWAAFSCFVFPTLAYFNENIKETIKHAFILSIKNGVFTFFIMLINLLPFILIVFLPNFYVSTSLLWITFGFALLAYVNSTYFARIFDEKRLNNVKNSKKNDDENY